MDLNREGLHVSLINLFSSFLVEGVYFLKSGSELYLLRRNGFIQEIYISIILCEISEKTSEVITIHSSSNKGIVILFKHVKNSLKR